MDRIKRLLNVFSVIICLLLCSCLIVGCGDSGGGENENTNPKHTIHNWPATYTEDGSRHFQTCDGCDEKKYGEHSYTNGTCVCGKVKPTEKPETPPAHTTHNWSTSYTNDGDRHYQTCDGCDEKKYGEHDYTNGNCICGKVKPTEKPEEPPIQHVHEWSTEWNSDANNHWHECKNCNEIKDREAHSTAGGSCTICSKMVYSEGLEYTLSNDGESYILSGIGACTDIDIDIPSVYNGKPITIIGNNAFYECSSLTSITIPDGVTSIGDSAFYRCSSLTSVTIPDGVTSIGDSAFYWCSSLTSVTIPDSVANIGGWAFDWCDSLMSITIPDGVTSVEDGVFCNCHDLTGITIPDSVTSIGDSAFGSCYSLTSITIPQSVTAIEDSAFYDCSSLESITIPDSVTSIGVYVFDGCSSLTSITVDKNNSKYHSDGNCLIETSTKTLIAGCKNSIIPSDGSVTSIGKSAFYGSSNLISIMIPDGVTSIGDYAFYGCSGLTGITIGNSVTSIGFRAFDSCSSLTSITVDKNNSKYHSDANCLIETSTKTLIAGCKNSIIPSDGSVTSIGARAFAGCSNLTSITIPQSVTSIEDYAFFNCRGFESITIGNKVTSIGYRAFDGCYYISKVYYMGDAEDWEKISIDDVNGFLTEATRYYYSETQPTSSGNYWHYVNGEIVEW